MDVSILKKAGPELSKLDFIIALDDLMINVEWFKVGIRKGFWQIARHMHSTYEFHFIYRGSSKVILDNREFIVQEGEFYLTAPSIHHKQIGISSGQHIEYSINCGLQPIDGTVSEGVVLLNIFREAQCEPVKDAFGAINIFNTALLEAYNKDVGYYNNIKSTIIQILSAAARAINQQYIFYDVPLRLDDRGYKFACVKKFVEDNISNQLTVSDISSYMHMSKRQIYRIVKEKLGISVQQFITQVKLNKCKGLLENTNYSMKEISYRLGFSSQYYFAHFFKRNTSYTPSEYRNMKKNVL